MEPSGSQVGEGREQQPPQPPRSANAMSGRGHQRHRRGMPLRNTLPSSAIAERAVSQSNATMLTQGTMPDYDHTQQQGCSTRGEWGESHVLLVLPTHGDPWAEKTRIASSPPVRPPPTSASTCNSSATTNVACSNNH
ncbi:hypothetical protein QAD02_004560 [Eretmocerus hayati]|uniref:Uncharacterized protein n=1 Tax=Eretmocerus hayati TaxID=131215 RepID=A0ACC2NQ31_9HYME|nr:hypothetical protein QAD02_004560 [Eretmocerus hayati]